nr:glucose-methanol-choline oxidoreductase, FAD/NAD(P)-binding domain protein [Tanacetum cinerariifolium]
MGSYRSKEDDVSRISTSIYVSNFPESCSAKDFFHSCNQYGYVVDTFIPFKRAKDGKRFGFVRFINVFNVERLVSNLCTIWVDRSRFHENIARFHRAPLNNNKVLTKQKFGYNRNINNVRAEEGVTTSSSKSYVHAVKVKNMFGALECDSMPSIVLDDECLISKDLSKALLGRVQDFMSLPNLKIVLKNEGVGSWFSVLKQTSSDLIPEGKIVWVEIEGIPFKLWSKNTFKRIVAKWGELLDVDDQEKEGFHSKRLCIYSKSGTNIYENFKVIFQDKVFFIHAKEVPGWVPEFVDDSDDDDESDNGFKDGDTKVQDGGMCGNDSGEVEVSETVFKESLEQKVNQSEDPFGIYLLFNKNKDKSENMKPSDHSLKYPTGFTPNGDNNEFCMHEENVRSGVWLKTGVDILMVVVYAPQDLRDKRILWDYLEHVINQYDGEVVTMGDFNEVRFKSERFGSVFNVQCANVFNMFIANAGLEEMDLECAVSKEELKRAVWECGTDKSPGPDGLSFGFYRQFWSSIENDVFVAVSHFFTFEDIPNGCNSCFIALILKVPDANLKKQSLIFKVDFEKAYDSVRWDFLDDVLKKFGFGNKWCAWIQSCLRSSRDSIIINGIPTKEFQFFKGLKQGDPLSTFLFILIMESLHLSLQRVVDVGMFKGINLSPLVNLSHMFYADDAVFVGQWCDGNINTLVHVLECFFQVSGLRINMCKSNIMRVNVGDEKVKSAASKLGCPILNTLFSYLGTKVGGNMSRVQAWTKVVNKASWVKWKSVLASKEKGGLEVSSLYALNRALWVRVIKAIYSDDGQVGKVSRAGSRSCWRNLLNEVRILSNQDYLSLLDDLESSGEELYLSSKSIKNLQDNICMLKHLKSLEIRCFLLEKLPEDIGQLEFLERLNRSKDGKRFGFVRFINVFNVERLVSNLCTIWVDRSKFHANIARFHRAPLNNNKVPTEQKFGYNRNNNNVRAKEGVTTGSSKSYVHTVKVKNTFGALECDSMPSIVLNDECLISKDLSKALLGRVKDFVSLPNLKIVLKNKGFAEIKIQIIWVEIEGVPFKLWSKILLNGLPLCGESYWTLMIRKRKVFIRKGYAFTHNPVRIYMRISKLSFGKVFLIRAKEVPGYVPEFVEDSDDDDESNNGFKDGDAKVQDGGRCGNDSDEVEVSETVFEESLKQNVNQSEDPFGIYLLLNKNKDKSEKMKPFDHSLKYPPGFTPNGDNNEFCMDEENVQSVNEANSLNYNTEENQNG